MKKSRLYSHAVLKRDTKFWVVGESRYMAPDRYTPEDVEVEVRNVSAAFAHGGAGLKLFFYMRVRPHTWSNRKRRRRPKLLLCATRDMHNVVPLGPTELLAKVPLEEA